MTDHKLSDGNNTPCAVAESARQDRDVHPRTLPGDPEAPAVPTPIGAAGVGEQILALWDADSGWTVREIAEFLNVSRGAVTQVVAQARGASVVAPKSAASPVRPPAAAPARRPRTPVAAVVRPMALNGSNAILAAELVALPIPNKAGLQEIAEMNRRALG